ncbi:vWA domain-containing protein [Streptomyces pinistramenti]|uniref:vWA domain-containing protein n=1 Tax=Streptomyces pinistramenti TaxID=2884812 RepID=UPI001D0865CB|nr:VWA domain-containing protein [Streptomyces pinistramenti]MCB5908681.1 VWA domain-containing protein [Streptomyces pinistramenti]
MGIRSLLRNAFGRSKATREESGAAPSGTETPEPATPSATIPEAREESAPGAGAAPAPESESPATDAPVAEVPAARTAPLESTPEPAAPATASLPAQGSPVDTEPSTTATGTDTSSDTADADAGADSAAATATPPTESDAKPEAAKPEAATAEEATAEEATAEASAPAEEAPEADTAAKSEATEHAPADNPVDAPSPADAPSPTDVPAPAPSRNATSEDATSEAAPTGSPEPPVSLTKVEATAPGLVSLYKSAGAILDKHGLGTQRAAVYLVLDRSGSMRNYYKDGTVQHLAEQALGLSANLDDDGTVPVVFFSTDVDGTADLDLAHYEGRIEELHAGLGHMGRTNYHWAIEAVVKHYKKSGSTAPAFVIFQTDGAPTSKPAAEKALCEAAGLPIFWQFIGFGDPEAKGFDFLRKLDDLAVPDKRVVDNAGFFHAGRDPRALSSDELYQQLMVEFPEWLTEARAAGVLKHN